MARKIALLIVVFMFVTSSAVFAETTTTTSTESAFPPIKTQIENTSVMKGDVRAAASANKMVLKDAMQEKKDAFKSQIEALKDEKKKAIVERINDNIGIRNTKLTGVMTDSLTRMSAILTKLKDKAAALKTSGKDTKSVDAAIVGAQTAITNAQAIVTTQAQKTYTAPTLTNTNLKTVILQMFNQFKTDITATHESVNSARKALVVVLTEIAKINGNTTATASGALQQ